MDKVSLVNGRLIKSNENMILDFNAIAQGYSVDLIAEMFEGKNIKNYLVEIGGEVRTKGRNQNNRIWRVGIDKPEENNMIAGADLQAIISLRDRALATSGNYRKFYVKNGIKYVHTIDPKTGYPVVSNLLSATVVAPDCTTADAYATAMMVVGVNKSLELLKQHKELDALLIYTDVQGKYQVYISPGLKKSGKYPLPEGKRW
jgi:thiamine biosynthesis lipoprotein